MKKFIVALAAFLLCFGANAAPSQPAPATASGAHLTPCRIVLQSGGVENAELLLVEKPSQAVLGCSGCARMKGASSILLDFGREIQGSVKITTGQYPSGKPVQVRIRLGESVSEACSNADPSSEGNAAPSSVETFGASNDHAIRDFVATLPWLGSREFGSSGFRFVRIDLAGEDELLLRSVEALESHTSLPVAGTFRCSDERLSSIWNTGAYTLLQCSRDDYIWDGIKRDRLVWIGDMHPEVMTSCAVFGDNPAVRKSLDLVRDETPLPAWMNGISSYSIWWLLIQRDFYLYCGDKGYLLEQQDYICALLKHLASKVDPSGHEHLDGNRFLDWPSSGAPNEVNCGLHAMMILAMRTGLELLDFFTQPAATQPAATQPDVAQIRNLCADALQRLCGAAPSVVEAFYAENACYDSPGRKQAAALMTLAGMMEPDEASDVILHNGPSGFSTFYGYYMLEALARAGKFAEAQQIISQYWGGMLDLGATTFWEDFNILWLENAGRIDQIPSPDKVDVHKSYGDYCYKGYRHSFCHGWASGPTPWMSCHILGVYPLEPGFNSVSINPKLGSLDWAEGSFPTPKGILKIRVEKQAESEKPAKPGTPEIIVSIDAPKGIKIVPATGIKVVKASIR